MTVPNATVLEMKMKTGAGNLSSRFPQKKEILLITETSRSFARGILCGVMQYVQMHQTWNLFHLERNIQEKYPDWLTHWRGDGIISRSGSTELCNILATKGVPVVELLGDGKKYPAHVSIDEQVSTHLAAEHFYQRGFRHFGFFSLGHNWWSQERCDRFVVALESLGCTCSVSPTTKLETDASLPLVWRIGIENRIVAWVDSLPKPVGVFCPWDIHALHFMNICRLHGVSVPEQVAVLGYGNNADLCRWSEPSLSSIAPNGREVGFRAAELLAGALAGRPLPEASLKVPPSHIEARNSTDFTAVRNPVLIKAIRFIRDNISGNPGVADLVRHLKVSRSTILRMFTKELGCTPNEEIMRRRMDWAKQLLRETDMTVVEIANQLAFSSPSSFVRSFRTTYGMTPQEFRSTINKNGI
ncbi:MAG: substrate-binding domain-containing protein [Planctomycetia bacterium]|nr:substrate-binding domain-containing protein [Planctomycetia bacterium]